MREKSCMIHGDGSRDSFWIILQYFNSLYKKTSCAKGFALWEENLLQGFLILVYLDNE